MDQFIGLSLFTGLVVWFAWAFVAERVGEAKRKEISLKISGLSARARGLSGVSEVLPKDAGSVLRKYWPLAVFGGLIILWLVAFLVRAALVPAQDLGGAEAGNSFGGLNALFTGMAFAGFLVALFLQRQDLANQRKELALTREVFSVQQHEASLFAQLNSLENHIGSIEGPSTWDLKTRTEVASTYRGRRALEAHANALPKQKIVSTSGATKDQSPRKIRETLVLGYAKHYKDGLDVFLGPYFRTLYNILAMIDRADFAGEDEPEKSRRYYAKLVRARLSSAELKLVFLNCAVPQNAKFRALVEKYQLLKHLPAEEKENYSSLVGAYDKSAFVKPEGL